VTLSTDRPTSSPDNGPGRNDQWLFDHPEVSCLLMLALAALALVFRLSDNFFFAFVPFTLIGLTIVGAPVLVFFTYMYGHGLTKGKKRALRLCMVVSMIAGAVLAQHGTSGHSQTESFGAAVAATGDLSVQAPPGSDQAVQPPGDQPTGTGDQGVGTQDGSHPSNSVAADVPTLDMPLPQRLPLVAKLLDRYPSNTTDCTADMDGLGKRAEIIRYVDSAPDPSDQVPDNQQYAYSGPGKGQAALSLAVANTRYLVSYSTSPDGVTTQQAYIDPGSFKWFGGDDAVAGHGKANFTAGGHTAEGVPFPATTFFTVTVATAGGHSFCLVSSADG
jgi:hypothetical protein